MTIKKFYELKVKETEKLDKETYPVFLYLLHVLNYSETELYLHFNDHIEESTIEKFNEGYNKYLLDNEPIQYLIGKHQFFGYDFVVDKRVLIPRFETEELVENILMYYDQYFDQQEVSACDIGCGSGAIAITINKEEPRIKMIGTDISFDALEVAKLNNEKLEANVEFLQGDMLEPLKGKKFDIVISNPPYIPLNDNIASIVKDNEPNVALFGGEDGLKFYRIILEGVKDIIKDKAIIGFEHGYNMFKNIEDMANQYLPGCKVIHKKDLQGKERMTFIMVGDFKC